MVDSPLNTGHAPEDIAGNSSQSGVVGASPKSDKDGEAPQDLCFSFSFGDGTAGKHLRFDSTHDLVTADLPADAQTGDVTAPSATINWVQPSSLMPDNSSDGTLQYVDPHTDVPSGSGRSSYKSARRLNEFVVLDEDQSGAPRPGNMGFILLGRLIAGGARQIIKVCNGAPGSDAEKRFMREYQFLVDLSVQGFPLVTGFYNTQDGKLCYSMSYIEGANLKQLYEAFHTVAKDPARGDTKSRELIHRYLNVSPAQSRYSDAELAQAFSGIIDKFIGLVGAVETMHKKGLIHRDLKPANIIVESSTGIPVVVDLGLTVKVGSSSELGNGPGDVVDDRDEGVFQTQGRSGSGTPAYMAPEQLGLTDGANDQSPATDVYALGAMLYHLISGHYQLETTSAKGKGGAFADFQRKLAKGEIERPKTLGCIRSGFAELEAICNKAMALKPDERYPTVRAMIDDLTAWREGEAVQAFREVGSDWPRLRGIQSSPKVGHYLEGLRYSFYHWAKSNSGWWAVIKTLGFVTAAGSGIGGSIAYSEASRAKAVAATATTSFENNRERGEYRLRSYLTDPEDTGKVYTIETLPVTLLDRLRDDSRFGDAIQDGINSVEQELKDPKLTGSHPAISRLRNELGEYSERLKERNAKFGERAELREANQQKIERLRELCQKIDLFYGSDVENFMTQVSHEDFDKALAVFLPEFEGLRDDELLSKFPDCSEGIARLIFELNSGEFSEEDRSFVRNSVARLLELKVRRLEYAPGIGYANHAPERIESCFKYLELADVLSGDGERLASRVIRVQLRPPVDDSSVHERTWIEDEVRCVVDSKSYAQLSEQDCLILAADLFFKNDIERSMELFTGVLQGNPKSFSAQIGLGRCMQVMAQKEADAEKKMGLLNEAVQCFSYALGMVSQHPGAKEDKITKGSSILVSIAAVYADMYLMTENNAYLDLMERFHEKANQEWRSQRNSRAAGWDNFNVGRYDVAVRYFTDAIERSNGSNLDSRAGRARAYAYLGNVTKLNEDVDAVLLSPQAGSQALLDAALGLVEYVDLNSIRLDESEPIFDKVAKLLTRIDEMQSGSILMNPAVRDAFSAFLEEEPSYRYLFGSWTSEGSSN